MADRSIVVTLKAVVSDFKSKFEQAGKASSDLADRLEKSRSSIDHLGGVATAGGIAIAAGLGFAAKAAIDWESAWAGVKKTVDGSDAQLKALEGSLREMARTMPATHTEIAAVAEAAGQLGVATNDVAGFTKTMIMLGETTNLTADEAATAIAQIQNITGMAAGDIDKFAATLVKLGNNGASTEAEILSLANRIAGAANIVGLAEKDLLALSNAMASAGIQAELGGSAMSRALIGMNTAVLDGGEKLEAFAEVAGMSAQQFADAWKADPVTAVEAFVHGLARINEEGGNTAAALADVGLKGTQNTQVFLALAGAADMLSESIAMAGDEWESSGALIAEYEQRLKTTEAQIQIAWNNVKDAAINAGAVMLPAIAAMAQGVAGLAQFFGGLPGPVHAVGAGLATFAAGSLLAAGGIAKLIGFGLDLHGNISQLRAAFPSIDAAMGKVGWRKAALAVGALTAAVIALSVAQDANRSAFERQTAGADDLAAKLLQSKASVLELNKAFTLETRGLFSGVTKEVDGLGEALARVLKPTAGQGFEDFFNGLVTGGSAASAMSAQLKELDGALASLVASGNGDVAAKLFHEVVQAAQEQGIEVSQLTPLFEGYADALRQSAGAAGQAKTGAELLATGLGQVAEEAFAASEAMIKIGNNMLALSGSQIGFEAALVSATDAIKEYGKAALDASGSIDIKTKSGRELKGSLDSVASASLSVIEGMMKTGKSTEETTAFQVRAASEFISTATAMGMSSEKAITLASDYQLIPRNVATAISAPGAKLSESQTRDLIAALFAVPSLTNAQVLAPGARPSKGEVDAFSKSIGEVPGLTTAQIRAIADLYGVEQAKRAIEGVQGKTVQVVVNYRSTGVSQSRVASAYASGGPIVGTGTGTSDSILALVSNGEYVIRAASVAKLGLERLDWLNRFGELPRFATGGQVASAPIHYAPSYSAPPATSSSAGMPDRRSIQMPRELVVVDADGQLVGRMRVEARGAVHESISTGRGRR